jgi:hypothetical protein
MEVNMIKIFKKHKLSFSVSAIAIILIFSALFLKNDNSNAHAYSNLSNLPFELIGDKTLHFSPTRYFKTFKDMVDFVSEKKVNVFDSRDKSQNSKSVPPKANSYEPSGVGYQQEALRDYQILMMAMKKPYPKEYGGAYIDKLGNLNINIVGNSIKKFKDIVSDNKIVYHRVKYPYFELERIINILNKKMMEMSISAIELDEVHNRVSVYLVDLNETNIKKIKILINSNAIKFKKQIGTIQVT